MAGIGGHWARQVMNQKTRSLVSALPAQTMDALEISGRSWAGAGWKYYRPAPYPGFDVCEGGYVAPHGEPTTFDIVLAEQVFEHLKFPYRAARNIYSMLNPGGYFLLTVPFLIKVHPTPIDCTRWTAEGLKWLLVEAGFNETDIVTESWGNRACVVANFDSWETFDSDKHSLFNDPILPIVTWGIAKKA